MVLTPAGSRPRPEIFLAESMIAVEPGSIAQTKLQIKYVGEQVAKFQLSLVDECEAAPWTEIVPSEINQLRGDISEVTVLFKPPRSPSVKAGKFPFAIRVLPQIADDRFPVFPAVVEGDIAVGAINALDVTIVPIRSKARLRGRYRIDVENKGTETVRIELEATDGEDHRRLQFALGRTTLAIAPGKTASSFLRVRPDRIMPLGQPVSHTFDVGYRRRAGGSDQPDQVGTGESLSKPATFTQRPIISRWMIVAALLVALVIALLIAWGIRNRAPELVRPPEAPELGFTDPAVGAATLSIRHGGQPADSVEAVIIDCDQLDLEVRPPSQFDSTTAELDGESVTVTLTHDRVDNEDLCAQARLIAGGVQSKWQVTREVVGAAITFGAVPPTVQTLGPNRIAVSWEPPVSEFALADLTFDVLINDVEYGPPIEAGGLRWTPGPGVDLPSGPATVRVRAIGPDGSMGLSQPEDTIIPADEGVPNLSGVWLYFDHQPAEGGTITTQELVEIVVLEVEAQGSSTITRARLKAHIVGVDVNLPPSTQIGQMLPDALPSDGDRLQYIDGFADEEDAIAACRLYAEVQARLANQMGVSIPLCQVGRT